METITRTRGESVAASATAGVFFQADHPSDHLLWTPEGLADETIDVPRLLAIVSRAMAARGFKATHLTKEMAPFAKKRKAPVVPGASHYKWSGKRDLKGLHGE